jgi:large subunit ribosomal protein L11
MIVKLIVEGGNMKPGPAVSQQLGPLGINLGKVIQDVNDSTAGFKGMKVPVKLDVNPKTKEFLIEVSSPPVAELIKKEINVKRGSGNAGKLYVGNLAIEEIISISKTKMQDMLAKDLKAATKLTLGSCVSAGVLVENKNAKEIILEINSGKYGEEIAKEKTEVSQEKKEKLDEFFSETKKKQEALIKEEEKAKEEEKEEGKSEEIEIEKESKDDGKGEKKK